MDSYIEESLLEFFFLMPRFLVWIFLNIFFVAGLK